MAETTPTLRGIYLGCPFWGLKTWVGTFYRGDARPRDFLAQYSSVFNSVEGNTTFYSLPSQESVLRWKEQTPSGFRFAFKFPQTITHQRELQNVDRETSQFLRRLAPLEERLGPLMLQFPKALSPSSIDVLWRFLPRLPKDFRYAVELRHPGFFRSREAVAALEERLEKRGCGRVIMDTRALRSGDTLDAPTREALHRKPDLAVYPGYSGEHPIIRFIGHPQKGINTPWLQEWARDLSSWIRRGKTPFFFVHLPDNTAVPSLGRRFHSLLNREVDIGELPPWPCDGEPTESSQLELF